MRRSLTAAGGCMVVVAALTLAPGSGPSAGQDRTEERLAALETAVARLATAVASIEGAPASQPALAASPAAIERSGGAIVLTGTGDVVTEPFVLREGLAVFETMVPADTSLTATIYDQESDPELVFAESGPYEGQKAVKIYPAGESFVVSEGAFTMAVTAAEGPASDSPGAPVDWSITIIQE